MSALKSMSNRVGAAVGFDPTVIITIITTIVNLLKNCKNPASKNAADMMIEEEFLNVVRNKRADKCPLQFRRAFRENGIREKEDMNDIWEAMVLDAKDNKSALASALVA